MGMLVTISDPRVRVFSCVMSLGRFGSVIVRIAMRTHAVQVPDGLDRHQDGPVPGCAGRCHPAGDAIGEFGMGLATERSMPMSRFDRVTEWQRHGGADDGFARL
jgi:hypothetical protein